MPLSLRIAQAAEPRESSLAKPSQLMLTERLSQPTPTFSVRHFKCVDAPLHLGVCPPAPASSRPHAGVSSAVFATMWLWRSER